MLDKLAGLATVAAAAIALPSLLSPSAGSKAVRRSGSPNHAGMEEHLVRQVIGFLGESGIPAARSEDGGPQVRLGTDDETVANGAHAVAERVLLSTGYRPQTVKLGGEYRIAVAKGPPAPASADRALKV